MNVLAEAADADQRVYAKAVSVNMSFTCTYLTTTLLLYAENLSTRKICH